MHTTDLLIWEERLQKKKKFSVCVGMCKGQMYNNHNQFMFERGEGKKKKVPGMLSTIFRHVCL